MPILIASRRHRPASELQVPGGALPALSETSLTGELRAELWRIVHASMFAATVSDASAIRRVWTAPPIGGHPDRIPADVSTLLESWFSLVEPADVYAFVETVYENLEPTAQQRFTQAVHRALAEEARIIPS